ncbi:DsbA family protein [Dyadobacter sp. CY261]|uniref:ClpXP adapter SpxH family protein n=1 Tax=Dyadobacter sp. CY261 TaxID=2907203 RepID=UPI001F41EB1A|nr:ClpXP adapter SpxH family protein [Dyadobacter sp. CY261]MCF0071080.1 DsbA family protein [Dyadobacter sp. CY261]
MTIANSNPLLCDVESGICEMPGSPSTADGNVLPDAGKPVRIIYFTDPICSSCWGIEPQLRKLKLEYSQHFEIEYRMGGLLPDWTYNSGGISKPSDVAGHWDEVSVHYDMPIDGDVWLEDPLHSSYPPSVAFKAAQLQGQDKAIRFLRELREMVFLKKINITKWENLKAAAGMVGLDITQFENSYRGDARELFKGDLDLAAQLGVRGFPTLFFINQKGEQEKIYGTKPYPIFEAALHNLLPTLTRKDVDTDWKSLFSKYNTLTSREFSELSETPRSESDAFLQKLMDEGELTRFRIRNGILWIRE